MEVEAVVDMAETEGTAKGTLQVAVADMVETAGTDTHHPTTNSEEEEEDMERPKSPQGRVLAKDMAQVQVETMYLVRKDAL